MKQDLKKIAIALYCLYTVVAICISGLGGAAFVMITSLISYIMFKIGVIIKNSKYKFIITLLLVLISVVTIIFIIYNIYHVPTQPSLSDILREKGFSEKDINEILN